MSKAALGKHFLVVVADESRAILYTHDTRSGPLTEWRSFDNETARAKTADLMSDRGGRAFDSHGQGRHTMSSEKSGPKQHAASVFARQIAGEVTADVNTGRCRGFALIAAPRFLGELRDALSSSTKVEPYVSVNKDVVGKDPSVISALLADARGA